ncbi:MAG: sugar phosphate isomerase/epimerase family protein [Saprospiraceae bacterium]
MKQGRRKFIRHTGLATGAGLLWLYGCGQSGTSGGESGEQQDSTAMASIAGSMFFKISLAQWSLHRTIREKKELDNLDFAATARNKYGIDAVEYVNQFFADKAKDQAYLADMKQRAADNGVTNVLIMIDNEGGMAETGDKLRQQAIENHYKWVDAAHFLGCHSIRVNAFSSNPDPVAAASAAADGLSKLANYAKPAGINIIVENHGGFSSNGQWLSGVMELVGMDNVGTLPDFGNFCIRRDNKDGSPWEGDCVEEYDRYKGVAEMMPFAKGVSAKSHDFDENGNCVETDYVRMLKVVKEAGYTGRIGIEYEGDKLSEDEGIRRTKALLERVGAELG